MNFGRQIVNTFMLAGFPKQTSRFGFSKTPHFSLGQNQCRLLHKTAPPPKLISEILKERSIESGKLNYEKFFAAPAAFSGDGGKWQNFDSNAFIRLKELGAAFFMGIGSFLLWTNSKEALCEGQCQSGDCECDRPLCLEANEQEEQKMIMAAVELEAKLRDVKRKAIDDAEIALKGFKEAKAAIKNFLDAGYFAIGNDEELGESEYMETWCKIYYFAKMSCEMKQKAVEKSEAAWTSLCDLADTIENGYACCYTKCNPLLPLAAEALECAECELSKARCSLDDVLTCSPVFAEFQTRVEQFKKELKDCHKVEGCISPCCFGNCCELALAAYKELARNQKILARRLVCMQQVPDNLRNTSC